MPFSTINRSIPIRGTTATGRTPLSAFHRALAAADVEHYNLIRLSSVIPPGTGVDPTGAIVLDGGRPGDRLYCVYAERRATVPGAEAWAGLGWVRRSDDSGGIFVEHAGGGKSEVEDAIRASLADVTGDSPGWTEPAWMIRGAVCTGEPVCALVIAPYESSSWGAGCA